MKPEPLEAEVLVVLQRNKLGLTATDVVGVLADKRRKAYGALTFQDEVALRTDVERALFTLKSKHHAWPHEASSAGHSATNTSGGTGHTGDRDTLVWRYIERGPARQRTQRKQRKIPQRRTTRRSRGA